MLQSYLSAKVKLEAELKEKIEIKSLLFEELSEPEDNEIQELHYKKEIHLEAVEPLPKSSLISRQSILIFFTLAFVIFNKRLKSSNQKNSTKENLNNANLRLLSHLVMTGLLCSVFALILIEITLLFLRIIGKSKLISIVKSSDEVKNKRKMSYEILLIIFFINGFLVGSIIYNISNLESMSSNSDTIIEFYSFITPIAIGFGAFSGYYYNYIKQQSDDFKHYTPIQYSNENEL